MAQTLRYTLVPERDTLITVRIFPDAACILYLDTAEEHLKLYADDNGIVRVYVHPPANCKDIAHVTLESGGEKYHLCLRAAHEPSLEYPFHVPYKVSRKDAKVRSALTVHEAETLCDEELISRGYSPRPTIDGSSGIPEAWLRSVTTPYTWVQPKSVARPDIGRGYAITQDDTTEAPFTKNLPNWSGFELSTIPSTFTTVMGGWTVPKVSGRLLSHDFSSIWVGIDGDGLSDLVQAGTQQESFPGTIGGLLWTFHHYFAWTEFLPQQATSQMVPNLPVNAGDAVFFEVRLVDGGGNPDPAGNTAQFIIRNDTTHEITAVLTPRGTTTVLAAEALWIVERPSVNNVIQPLANYGSVTISTAWAQRWDGRWLFYSSGNVPGATVSTVQITMRNNAQTSDISTVVAVDDQTMTFTWEDSQ